MCIASALAIWVIGVHGVLAGNYSTGDGPLLLLGHLLFAWAPFWALTHAQRGWLRAALGPSLAIVIAGFILLLIAG
ncbi:MAG: hypothetical protein V9E83_04240 [Baekduia sp.]